MNAHLKISAPLLASTRDDLLRAHRFAHERVGFLFAGVAAFGRDLILLVRDYRPVEDDDYIDDPSVGAMMGPGAIRKALQHAHKTRSAAIHVHIHGHRGTPDFSGIDNRENAKFVPNFFNVAAFIPHGAVVLSHDDARGHLWLSRSSEPIAIDRFSAVGAPLWSGRAAA